MLRLSGTELAALRACPLPVMPPVAAGRLLLDSTHPAVASLASVQRCCLRGSLELAANPMLGPDAKPRLFAGVTRPSVKCRRDSAYVLDCQPYRSFRQ